MNRRPREAPTTAKPTSETQAPSSVGCPSTSSLGRRLGRQPLVEGRANHDRAGSGQKDAAADGLTDGTGDYLHAVSLVACERGRHGRKVFGPGSGNLDEVTVSGAGSDVVQHLDHGRHGERLNHEVGDGRRVAGAAPADCLPSDVVELCRPDDVRPRPMLACGLLLGELGLVVAVIACADVAVGGGQPVYSDDGQHNDAVDPCASSGPSEVRRDGREELRRVLLFEVRALDDVDDGLAPGECILESGAGEKVDVGLLRDAGDAVTLRTGERDELAAHEAGRTDDGESQWLRRAGLRRLMNSATGESPDST